MPGQDLIRSHQKPSRIRRRTNIDRHAATPAAHPLVGLQRKIGNAQVARMLVQRQDVPEEEEVATKRDAALQREAAPEEEEIATMRDPGLQREEEEEVATKRDPSLQREEEEELAMSRAPAVDREAKPEVGLAGGPISAGLSSRIESRRGGGSSLDSGTRSSMESSFGADFSGVRVHTDSESDALNRSVGAKAFTIGSDVFFSRNASPSDSHLLAHELTHVVQQGGSTAASGPMTVSAADDATEAQADAMAGTVTSGAATAQAARKVEDQAR